MEICDESLTVKQLKETCRNKGKRGYSRLLKSKLVEFCCDEKNEKTEKSDTVTENSSNEIENEKEKENEDKPEVRVIESTMTGGSPNDEVLECEEEKDGVWVRYAPFSFTGDREIKFEVKDGVFEKRNKVEWIGKCKDMISKANWVAGKTYNFKENIKSMGFSWNGENKRWERIIPLTSEKEEKIDPWEIANLSPNDDTCTELSTEISVKRTAGYPSLFHSCPRIVNEIRGNKLGNWSIYNDSKCQLVNSQTGWFINSRTWDNYYKIFLSRSFNYNPKKFESMWKPYFSNDDEFEKFKKVAECNGKKALKRYAHELEEINTPP